MDFPCSGCGACCRRVSAFSDEELSKWGLSTKDDGSCINLLGDNSCAIYETRPDICRVDVQSKKSDLPIKVYYEENIKICNEWMDEDGMSHLKIKL